MGLMNEKEMEKVFDYADRQREIEKHLQELLCNHAKAKKCYCTWLIEYSLYNEKVGFEFKIEVTSEDKKHKTNKLFYVGYEWEEEKGILKEIVLYLLRQLEAKQEK